MASSIGADRTPASKQSSGPKGNGRRGSIGYLEVDGLWLSTVPAASLRPFGVVRVMSVHHFIGRNASEGDALLVGQHPDDNVRNGVLSLHREV